MLCGHHRGIRRLTKTYPDGHSFTAVMYNLQADRKNANGYCVLLTFDPMTGNISFTSYSPVFDDYTCIDPKDETFTIENAYWTEPRKASSTAEPDAAGEADPDENPGG